MSERNRNIPALPQGEERERKLEARAGQWFKEYVLPRLHEQQRKNPAAAAVVFDDGRLAKNFSKLLRIYTRPHLGLRLRIEQILETLSGRSYAFGELTESAYTGPAEPARDVLTKALKDTLEALVRTDSKKVPIK